MESVSKTGLPWAPPIRLFSQVSGGDGAGILVGGDLWQPEVLHSQDGLLQVKIVAAQQEVDIRGCQAQVLAYNGTIPGWT